MPWLNNPVAAPGVWPVAIAEPEVIAGGTGMAMMVSAMAPEWASDRKIRADRM
jgi:hypothetical protein